MSPAEKRSPAHEALQLLLADAKEHRPVLEQGLAVESTRNAPRPRALPRRVEVPHHALMREYRAVNDRLMAGYQAQAEAMLYGTPDPTDPVKQGHLWMLRNDLRGYVLLGDPAARLAVRRMAP